MYCKPRPRHANLSSSGDLAAPSLALPGALNYEPDPNRKASNQILPLPRTHPHRPPSAEHWARLGDECSKRAATASLGCRVPCLRPRRTYAVGMCEHAIATCARRKQTRPRDPKNAGRQQKLRPVAPKKTAARAAPKGRTDHERQDTPAGARFLSGSVPMPTESRSRNLPCPDFTSGSRPRVGVP